jgi:G protein-coupled glucose receptor regulating Gpa2
MPPCSVIIFSSSGLFFLSFSSSFVFRGALGSFGLGPLSFVAIMAPVDSSSASHGYGNTSISPLPSVLHHGYIALSFVGFLSFFSTSALLGFLTWRLIRWRKSGYNQFILLIYNLVLADMQQSIAFFLNARWVHEDALETRTSACFAQGWFISIGQLGTGVWIFTIACHTFAAVVLDYRLSRVRFGIVVAALWSFIYLCAIIGVASHPSDIYERAGAWVCPLAIFQKLS